MKIVIKGNEYEYHSDHPNGWDLSSRDHFKGPVEIGPQSCFIKRFERKNVDDVSGWQLLHSLKGKAEPNLPSIYDIVHDQENGKDTYYVFFEYLEGTTLDKIINQKASFDPVKLLEDLFRAFYPIHIKNYWVINFTEQNIFCENDGRFLLVDLHHTYSMSGLTETDLIADNIYWKLVFNFYREILHQRNLKSDDLNGSSINYLQAVFLLLRLHLLYKENAVFDSENLIKKLPVRLAEASPSFKDIYANVFRSSELALPSRDVVYIKKVALEMLQEKNLEEAEQISVPQKEINVPVEKSPSIVKAQPPEIEYLILEDYTPDEEGTYLVADGESFTLGWAVKNAVGTELYRNEVQYNRFNNSPTRIELKETYRGSEGGIIYKLLATNPGGEVATKLLKLNIRQPLITPPVILQFSISGYTEKDSDEYHVTSGEPFTLTWKVNGAESLDIYKNGSLYQVLTITDQSIELEENLGKQGGKIVYTLHARNGYELSVSDPLNVNLIAATGPLPEIIAFTADNYLVDNRQQFTLTWSLKNTSQLVLYRNGDLYKELNPPDKSIRLKEAFADNQDQVEYLLAGSNGFGEVKSAPLVIKLKAKPAVSPPAKRPWLKIAAAILGVALLFLLARWVVTNFRHPDTVIVKIEPQNIYEDSSIIIYGKKLADAKTLQVLFNDIQGTIRSFGNDSLIVTIPDMKNKISATGDVTVTVKANGYDLFLYNYQWFDKSSMAVKKVNAVNFLIDTTVIVHCRNLDNAREIKIYFNYIKAKIKSRGGDSIIVSVPETIIDSIPKSIRLNVKEGIKDVYTYNFNPR